VYETLVGIAYGGDVILVTTSAALSFARIGFFEVERYSVPTAVPATRQHSCA
jgi:hypothetical protein